MAADVDSSVTTDISDATAIQAYLAEFNSALPVGEQVSRLITPDA